MQALIDIQKEIDKLVKRRKKLKRFKKIREAQATIRDLAKRRFLYLYCGQYVTLDDGKEYQIEGLSPTLISFAGVKFWQPLDTAFIKRIKRIRSNVYLLDAYRAG